MPQVHPLYAAMETTIFEHMSSLARQLGAINLGQGFPDGQGPPELIAAAARALAERSNQYPPCAGVSELREAVADFYARRQGLSVSPEQVIVTSGATEAIAATIMALIEPGDEVVLFQPAYDAYAPMLRRVGAVPVSLQLSPPTWRYDAERIESVLTERSKALILNDPHNPTGKVASETELMAIAEVCTRRDLLAICDEVWEDVRFDGAAHRSLMAFPGMAGRTVKIGSAGKIFGLTGWKIGWLCAGGAMAQPLARAHQFLTYTSPPGLQWAVAEGLALPDAWFAAQRDGWAASRRRLKEGLGRAGYVVLPGEATWFLCVDLAASGVAFDDRTFAERALREARVAAIPVSALCEGGGPRHIVRFCFTKSDATLDEAVARLARFRRDLMA